MHNDLGAAIGVSEYRPVQQKAIDAGLLEGRSLLVCAPTASGKTLVAEMAMLENILQGRGKAVYIVPLRALATEKYRDFKEKYPFIRVALSIGETDSSGTYLSRYDLVVTTSEKLDSLIRHHAPWLRDVKTVVVDEIHLIDEPGRGPTLEILITILRKMLSGIQLIGLSATIGNPQELSGWLGAALVEDSWRPVELKKGIYKEGKITFQG